MKLRILPAVAVAVLGPDALGQGEAAAQMAANPAAPTVEVVGTAPLAATGVDRDKVPANIQELSAADLTREGSASLSAALTGKLGGVSVNDTVGDGSQLDILYRGFTASPILGTPQGLAVYQNGVRINEAFGETVNWDLFPDVAIDHVDLFSGNPVYGLNALGGALALAMKNGFTYQGAEGEVSGGSFGRRGFVAQYGRKSGQFATYLAGKVLDEDGWRQFSGDALRQLYADLAWRGERGSLDIGFTGANNRLFGAGTTPVEELALARSGVFTRPQNNFNQLEFATLNGAFQATDDLSLQGNLYYREFRQTVLNGNIATYVACAADATRLCQPDGTTPVVGTGGQLPNVSGVNGLGQDDREWIRTVTIGGSLQTNYTGRLLGHDNNFVFGASIDHAVTNFRSSAEIGPIDSGLLVVPSGFFVNTPENTGFNATPVRLNATNDYYGIYATDTFDVTDRLAVTASGRINIAEISLGDQRGANLNGDSAYMRVNPAIGATYKLTGGISTYFGYSESNRAPTPSEIECSNPNMPCLLPSSLASDPPTLKQVVSHSYEAGLRGALTPWERSTLNWNFGLFRTDLDDDIYGVATSLTQAYFTNIGSTRRQGIEAGMSYRDESWSAYLNYALVDATFESSFLMPSPANPHADANGNILVKPGDRLPGIPTHQIKFGADYHITENWSVGGTLVFMSEQSYRGDEASLNPRLPGYEVVSLHGTYQVTPDFELFASVQNLFDSRYATFGQFGDASPIGGNATSRFLTPAAPVAGFGGVRVRF